MTTFSELYLMGAESMTKTVVSRRQILQAGAIGGLNLALPGLVTAQVDANRPLGREAAQKSCIFLWLCGGPATSTPGT